MDSKTNIQELKDKVKKFCEERDWDQYHDAKELAIGLILEASEILEPFRYMNKEQIAQYLQKNKAHFSDEIGDVMFVILRMAQLYDIDLSMAFNNKLAETASKYPIEKSKGKNKKYDEI